MSGRFLKRKRLLADLREGFMDGARTAERVAEALEEAAAEEREACAKLAESGQWDSTAAECSGECGPDIARAIRARH